jgi:hypothetical protein
MLWANAQLLTQGKGGTPRQIYDKNLKSGSPFNITGYKLQHKHTSAHPFGAI